MMQYALQLVISSLSFMHWYNPHQDLNPDHQDERWTTYQLSYPSALNNSYFIFNLFYLRLWYNDLFCLCQCHPVVCSISLLCYSSRLVWALLMNVTIWQLTIPCLSWIEGFIGSHIELIVNFKNSLTLWLTRPQKYSENVLLASNYYYSFL